MSSLGAELLELTQTMVRIPSVSHEEKELADFVQGRLQSTELEVIRVGDNVVARTLLDHDQRLLLAGHLDTVPASENQPVIVSEGRLQGLGAADMKGGLAVMLWLAESVKEPKVDLTWIFYVGEEVASRFNGLGQLQRLRPDLLHADAAVLGEPTSAQVEAGCQGTLRVIARFCGTRAHTARPWMGINAIHRLGSVLTMLENWQGREPTIGDCTYREALQAVAVSGGVAGNVVPDEAALTINFRFAPDRDEAAALGFVESLMNPFMGSQDTIEVVDTASGAMPRLDHPLLSALVETSGKKPQAKLGWTDVARFAALGVPAANFGPADPTLAHSPGEWVSAEELQATALALRDLVCSERDPVT